jgi:hypothetical protein
MAQTMQAKLGPSRGSAAVNDAAGVYNSVMHDLMAVTATPAEDEREWGSKPSVQQ